MARQEFNFWELRRRVSLARFGLDADIGATRRRTGGIIHQPGRRFRIVIPPQKPPDD
jgi:hypothetical protein